MLDTPCSRQPGNMPESPCIGFLSFLLGPPPLTLIGVLLPGAHFSNTNQLIQSLHSQTSPSSGFLISALITQGQAPETSPMH